jgi:hypothetical protein
LAVVVAANHFPVLQVLMAALVVAGQAMAQAQELRGKEIMVAQVRQV